MAEAEEKPTLPSTEIKPSVKKKRPFLPALLWTLFFLAFFAVTAFYGYNKLVKNNYSSPPVVEEMTVSEPEPQPEIMAAHDVELAETPVADEPVETPVVMEPVNDEIRQEVAELNSKIGVIEEQNRNIFIYFLARDLQDSIADKEDFAIELQGLRRAIGDQPEIMGRIDILEQSIAGGYNNPAKLKEELKLVEKNVVSVNRRGFSNSVSGVFSELVKISKVEGEIKDGDYSSIIKRAEIALSTENIRATDLERTINEVAKLGKPAESWVQKAKNLLRIIEVTDYLVSYSKAKVTAND